MKTIEQIRRAQMLSAEDLIVADLQAKGLVPAAPKAGGAVPEGMGLVPLEFLQGFGALAHNYSLGAEAPDYYDGRAGDAFAEAYRRCGNDLAKLRAMLSAAPAIPAPQPPREPLTEEQREEIHDEMVNTHGFTGEDTVLMVSYVIDATERAHGIGAARNNEGSSKP